MDTEVLIAEVGKRGILWDRTNRLHHNRVMIHKSWTEISLILDCSVKEARTKWKNLKDHFRKEFKKEQIRQETNVLEDTSEVSWCHFKSLMFLQDQMICSASKSSKSLQDATTVKTELSDKNEEILNGEFEVPVRDDDLMDSDSNFYKVDKSEVFVVDAPDNDPLPTDPIPNEELFDTNSPVKPSTGEGANEFRPKIKSKTRNNNISSPRGPPKKKQKTFGGSYDVMSDYGKMAGIDKKTGKPNENYHFVMTLLPHLDRLTPAKRLTVQIKIQQAVFSAIYGNDRSSSDSTPSYDSASSY